MESLETLPRCMPSFDNLSFVEKAPKLLNKIHNVVA